MQDIQFVKKGDGEDFDYAQDHCFVKISSDKTGGQLSMVEDVLKPGFLLSRHHHKQMTEVFYVLEGDVDMMFDDKTIVLNPGDTLTVPPNIWHGAKCDKGGRMLSIFHNGRFDKLLEKFSTMSEEDFNNKELMQSVNEEFDVWN